MKPFLIIGLLVSGYSVYRKLQGVRFAFNPQGEFIFWRNHEEVFHVFFRLPMANYEDRLMDLKESLDVLVEEELGEDDDLDLFG